MNLRVTVSVCDVSVRAEREKLMQRFQSTFEGKLNILVNNAGTCYLKAATEYTAEDYTNLMATNFESCFHLSQLAHPLLKASGRGSIVQISSIAGIVAMPDLAMYAATKGAMNQLTKNLACEWARDGIRVNCIAPGGIRTPLVLSMVGNEEELQRAVEIGSKGIGHAIVEELAGFGASVHTCARNEAELNECLQQWRKMNLRVTVSVCDVSVRAEREKLMQRVQSMFEGKLNILVNNVGTCYLKAATKYTAEDYSNLMATNFESCFHLSQLAHPLLKASGRGSAVQISSIAGIIAMPDLAMYTATKGAMNQLTKNLACEWARDGVRVNCIAPGGIRTPLVLSMVGNEEELQRAVERAMTSLPIK